MVIYIRYIVMIQLLGFKWCLDLNQQCFITKCFVHVHCAIAIISFKLYIIIIIMSIIFFAGIALPYPARNFWPEVILLFFLGAVDGIRVFLGMPLKRPMLIVCAYT